MAELVDVADLKSVVLTGVPVRLRPWLLSIMTDIFEKLHCHVQTSESSLKTQIDDLTYIVPYDFHNIYWSKVTYPHFICTCKIVDAIDDYIDHYEY